MIVAQAQPNIALVKYWGKRERALNLPETSSVSITLRTLHTRTELELDDSLTRDLIVLETGGDAERLRSFLDLVRRLTGKKTFARVVSSNTFPTAAGLASSASGFAALAMAANAAYGLDLAPGPLSALARQGSGSAARSIFGGYVMMHRGERADGTDSVAEQLAPASHWPLTMLVAIVSTQVKELGSTTAMERTRASSPFFPAWVQSTELDAARMRDFIARRDFEAVGALTEHSCLKMHGLAMAADPGIVYWQPATVELIHQVRALRKAGIGAFFTIDAGPQVKVLCNPSDQARVAAVLQQVPGVLQVVVDGPGEGARIVS